MRRCFREEHHKLKTKYTMIKTQSWFPAMFCLISGIILFTKGNAQIPFRLAGYPAANLASTGIPFTTGSYADSQSIAASGEKSMREDFMIFPNTTKGNVVLKYFTQRHAAFQIYDASGRLMFFRILDQGENLLHMKTSLPEGVYIYTINDKSGYVLKTAKLVIVK